MKGRPPAIMQHWNSSTRNDRTLLLDSIGIVGRVAFQLTQLDYADLDETVQARLKELGK